MNEKLTPMDEIRAYMKEREQSTAQEETKQEPAKETPKIQAVVAVDETKKSITDLSVSDIKMHIDENKSMEQQAEDIVGAMATAKAVQDEHTAKELTEKKSEELLAKAEAKKKKAEAESIKAETDKQIEQRKLYEAVLEHFGVKKHLPFWLMVILTTVLSPLYVVMVIFIGTPFAVGKTVMDGLDSLVCRYEAVDEKCKPRIRKSILVLLIVLVVGAICLTILKVTNVI